MNSLSCWLRLAILGILSWAFPDNVLWASESGGGMTREFFWQLVSLVLLLVLLTYILKKPVRAFLSKRREEIKNSLEKAANSEDEAQRNCERWEGKLNSLSQEISELHQRISQEGELERKRIIERAQEEGQRIREQAQVVADQEVKKARAALKKDMVDLSLEMAEKLLQEAAQPADQERLVKEYIGKLRELR